ncbi:hypothetical protein LA5095_00094 [Roseibium album]|uniref:DUF4304 domain-containing protein n=2 Tax=Roseibium album TaxID=311410 RepID=A0A0M6ZE80_9HYPH|nr:hypothetical protein LA5094_03873 [Roseibium album]CTQ63966.1 hypothetical protein LA5095_00094 [Roseibium album]CTQ72431.1 hypothetical protein LA5096_03235 [Roseibium album]
MSIRSSMWRAFRRLTLPVGHIFEAPKMNLDSLMKDVVAPLLDEKGFRARNRVFRRVSNGFEHVVSFQKSQNWSALYKGKFCINLYSHPLIDGYPGFPKLPLSSGEHLFSRRMAVNELQDQWWRIEKLYRSDVREIEGLLSRELDLWFSKTESVKAFSENCPSQELEFKQTASFLGVLPCWLAYAHAAIFATLKKDQCAMKMADAALLASGPQADLFDENVREFKQAIFDRLAQLNP